MTDTRAHDPERLPWLVDEPRPRRLLTMFATLVAVLLATLLLAGLSYWLGMQSAGRPMSFGPLNLAPVDFKPADLWNEWRTAPAPSEPEPPAPTRVAVVRPLPAPGVQRAANPPAVIPPAPNSPAASQPAPVPPPAPGARAAAPRVTPAKPPSPPAHPAPAQAGSADKPPAAAQPNADAPASVVDQSRASFNCRLAKSRGEIAVCSNGQLGALDRGLATLTSQAWQRADAAKRSQLARTRVRFLARRDACPSDACISALYLDRMREISTIAGGPPNAPGLGPSSATAQAQTPPKVPAARAQPDASDTILDPKSPASFSCRLARTRGEITVCNSADLGKLDRQLAVLYDYSWGRADAGKRARLQRTRNRFLAQREACRSETCVNALYVARIREVGDITTGARPPQ